MDLPSRQELFDRWRAAAVAVTNSELSVDEILRPGSDLNLIAAAGTAMGEEIVNRMARALAGVFEDSARGDRLDRIVIDRKGLPRLPASPAVITMQLSRPTFAAGGGVVVGGLPGSSPTPTRIRTNAGIVYLLTQNAVFGATDLGPITVSAQAQLAGVASAVDANQTWSFVDAPFDRSIILSNPEAAAGASDEELDDDYRNRARGYFNTIRRGTLPAIDLGVRSTPGIASASVREIVDPATGYPAARVQAFLLDPLGRSNAQLAARVALNLLEYRAAGIPVQSISGTPQDVNIRFRDLAFDTALVLDTTAAFEEVRTQILGALDNQVPNQSLLRSTILVAARSVLGVQVEDSDLIEPLGTLIPATPDIVFRTRRELITVST